ncbi:MAG TPA: nuclear transport factor 2 family protein [Longimicrobiales bacterium]
MRRAMAGAALAILMVALLGARPRAVAAQAPGDSVAATIVALERAAMDRSDDADGGEAFLQLSAEDVVYMDPTLAQPIHGLPALTAYYRSFPKRPPQPTHGRFANVQVQVAGEVAVLTYNYLSVRNWNVTEVYRRTPAGWRIFHTHFSYLKP